MKNFTWRAVAAVSFRGRALAISLMTGLAPTPHSMISAISYGADGLAAANVCVFGRPEGPRCLTGVEAQFLNMLVKIVLGES
jgi:hypothetical protein